MDKLKSAIRHVLAEAEAADAAHSTVMTRVRLAHAKSMYIRAMALERLPTSPPPERAEQAEQAPDPDELE